MSSTEIVLEISDESLELLAEHKQLVVSDNVCYFCVVNGIFVALPRAQTPDIFESLPDLRSSSSAPGRKIFTSTKVEFNDEFPCRTGAITYWNEKFRELLKLVSEEDREKLSFSLTFYSAEESNLSYEKEYISYVNGEIDKAHTTRLIDYSEVSKDF